MLEVPPVPSPSAGLCVPVGFLSVCTLLDWFVIIYSMTAAVKAGCQGWSSLKTRAVLFFLLLKREFPWFKLIFLDRTGVMH